MTRCFFLLSTLLFSAFLLSPGSVPAVETATVTFAVT